MNVWRRVVVTTPDDDALGLNIAAEMYLYRKYTPKSLIFS